jgi:DNA polymerase-3 subunit alpha
MNVLEKAVEMGQQAQNDRRSGQMSMFGAPDPNAAVAAAPVMGALPDVPEFQPAELLKFEKELLGFYITSHPLTEHQFLIERYTTASTKECLTSIAEGTEVMIGCMLSAVRSKVGKTGRSAGKKWAILGMEDLEGVIEGMCFAETYEQVTQRYPDAISTERIVFVKGKVDKKRETPSIMVTDVLPIEHAIDKLSTGMVLKLDRQRHGEEHVEAAKSILRANKGTMKVWVQAPATIEGGEHVVTLALPNDFAVRVSQTLVDDLRSKLGNEAVDLIGAGSKRKKRLEQQRLFREEQAELAEVAPVVPASDELVAAAMDSEMEMAEA